MKKIRKILPEGFAVLQNNSFVFGDVAVCGTRGWTCPDGAFSDPHDEKIFQRELGRLKLSLDSIPEDIPHKIVMLHYPPVNGKHEKSAFVDLMEQYGVETCLYGHLHSYALQNAFEGTRWGIAFQLVSADYLAFKPKLICEVVGADSAQKCAPAHPPVSSYIICDSRKQEECIMKQVIQTNNAPQAIGPYSQAILAGDTLYVSGQIPVVPATGAIVSDNVEEQARQVMENVKAVVEAAGLTLDHVVKTSVFIKNMDDFAKINAVYSEYFKENCPARACVEVARLPKDVQIEMEAIAVK